MNRQKPYTGSRRERKEIMRRGDNETTETTIRRICPYGDSSSLTLVATSTFGVAGMHLLIGKTRYPLNISTTSRTYVIVLVLSLFGVHICTCASFVPASTVRWKHRSGRDIQSRVEASCTVLIATPPSRMLLLRTTASSSSDDPGTSSSSSPIKSRNGSKKAQASASIGEQSRRDILNIGTHLLGCFTAATAISTYEDYDVTHLKPNRATLRQSYLASFSDGEASIIGSATRGLAWNKSDRQRDIYELQFGEQAGREIESYNEVMERHRRERVPMWKKDRSLKQSYLSSSIGIDTGTNMSEETAKEAVVDIYNALRAILTLKILAADYEWDEMSIILDSHTLTNNLERATQTLRSAKPYLNEDARETIGFDWGSCAWRHCGAAADAQESLAELKCRLGLFEPFECLFCLDVVERSLRDIVAVIPHKLRPMGEEGALEEYIPYQPRSEDDGNFEGDGDESAFLGALSALRNDLFSLGQ